MDTTHPAEITQAIRTTQIIAGAIMLTVPVYAVVAMTVGATTEPPDADRLHSMAVAFLVLSVFSLLLARTIFASRARTARREPTPLRRLAAHRVAVIIAFALRETVAIYGLALSLSTGDPRWVIGFGAVALVTMAIGWPTRSQMLELATEVQPIE
jgi:hypothetical protein